MKKTYLLLVLSSYLLVGVLPITIGIEPLQAKPVTSDVAKTVASNFYTQTYNSQLTIHNSQLTISYIETDNNSQPVYYVFNVEGNNGFIIVSAEDAGYPVIGSSNTGNYVIPTSNSNLGFWMNKRKSEIISMRANNLVATSDVSSEWNTLIANSHKPLANGHKLMTTVSPLCKTIWNQSPYFNALCPESNSQQAVTGCVATAMAQIMKYWAFPGVGTGSWCYYDEQSYGYQENYNQLCANFDTTYAWAEMPDTVKKANYAVAKLMYDCGVSVDMDYSPDESAAIVMGGRPSAQFSYYTYFNYTKATLQAIMQSGYTDSAWLAAIENELNNKRPVQYQGADSATGGHSWVCDGYNASAQLHMNWGWSGKSNGYYTATALAPTGTGYNFSYANVGALIGIEPNKSAAVAQISNNDIFNVYPNPSTGIFNIQTSSTINGQSGMLSGAETSVEVYNVLGEQVYSQLSTLNFQFSINLSNQPKGVYFYRILNDTGKSISTGKLIIQ